MRVGTIASLAASAALGVGALVVARVWLPAQSSKPSSAPAGSTASVPVVLAAAPIAYGEKIEAKHLTLARLPADAAPPGAYASIDQVMKQDGGAPVALQAMSPREPVLAAKLSGSGARPTLAAVIKPGYRAYTIGVTEVAGGGGHVLPGDRVDVLLARELPSGPGMDGQGRRLTADVVIQDVRVLGMDLNTDPNSTRPAVAHTATLEVDMKDAEKLALAGQAGTLSLALRPVGAAEIESVHPILTSDLSPAFGRPGPKGARPSPFRRAKSHDPGPTASPTDQVIVVHGEARASVSVPAERLAAG